LYPGVEHALHRLKANDVKIIAYTESVAFWTEWRIKHTGLDGVIDVLYSAPDHDLPEGMTFEDLRWGPPEDYGLKITVHRHVPRHHIKPDPVVLSFILQDEGCDPKDAVYVGDSLLKDVQMAREVGVLDVHAKYGEAQGKAEYELLRRVSHWPDETVAKERDLIALPDIEPTFVLNHSFDQILPIFGL
jgi:FMN phosphatase YigB (HAD superfamily)